MDSRESDKPVPFIEKSASTACIAVAALLLVVFVCYGVWETWFR